MVENRRFNPPHLSLEPPLGVTPLEFRWDFWHQKTRRIALSYGIKHRRWVLWISHKARVWRTNGEADRRTELRLPRPR